MTPPLPPSMRKTSPAPRKSASPVAAAGGAYRVRRKGTKTPPSAAARPPGRAQARPPADLRLGARPIRERIPAQGDAPAAADADPAINQGDAMSRIQQAEGHYTDV